MKGKSFQQERLLQHDDIRDGRVRRSPENDPPKLGEIQLPSREWAVEQVVGYLMWKSVLRETDSVWFVAHSPSGKRYRWKVADVSPKLGTVSLSGSSRS